MSDLDYLDLPERVSDIGDLASFAHESYDWHEPSGTWIMSPAAKRFLADARAEIETIESASATALAQVRADHQRDAGVLLDRATSAEAQAALIEAGVERKMASA